jgi:acetylornithine deacetylase
MTRPAGPGSTRPNGSTHATGSTRPAAPTRPARLTPIARASAAAVDPELIAADLAALVQMRSITGDEIEIQGNLADWLEALGMTVEIFHPDPAAMREDPDWPGEEVPRAALPVVIGRAGRPGAFRLVLSGHVDVVPAGDPASWSDDAFSGEIRDGRLYGRGACDMKGGIAAILAAVRALRVSGALDTLQGELVVALVPSEEDGGQGTLAAIRAGVTGDLCVIPEPSSLDVIVAHAGAITFRLTVPGRAAHASRRTEGVSALDNLHTLVRALEADEKRRNAAETEPLMTALGLPYPTIIGKVAGGEWASSVMDRVVAEGRYGVRLGQDPEAAADELRACIAAACARDPFLRDHPATVDIAGARFGSARVAADHALPTGLIATARAITGRRPRALGVPYGADMRLFINVGDTPCVIFGPGDVRLAHGANESVPLAEVEACARVLAAWVAEELGAGVA